MEKEQCTRLQKATQDARRLLEEEFLSQLLQTYDIDVEKVRWAEMPGAHLQAEQRLIREKLVAWIEHKEAQINDRKEALLLALREMAFTALNRFVALKLMEARELVRPCVSGGLESAGFLEFTAVAQGLLADQESSYRLYLETIFEDVSREVRALFDPRDPASLLWPKRAALLDLLDILNRPEMAELWRDDETLGWVYQYFNGDAERKKMREESAAPRNSRELAVRNQFFTPRYVVEYLTDNTLGRIWYEMRQGETRLKHRCRYLVRRPKEIWLQPGEDAPAQPDTDLALSQEELLRQPVHIPHRELKDPREIRMLDPACGSMHFGLYAFDLYLKIYEEAWEVAQCSNEMTKQVDAFAPFVEYAEAFADKASFLREVPRLILLHNIHGIDIDPRATQIARLTLWLRAQKAWQEQQLEVADHPPITRSNVVCAEPMPGEQELLADFVDHQFPKVERGLVLQLLEAIFDKMQLAGEAGSLLKIEEEIRDAIDQARREWQKLAVQQQELFSTAEWAALVEVGSSLNTDLQNLTKDFWINIEERIYTALGDYAGQTENGSGFQRRLFAEDAAQGFAFIDVSRKRYDVALMNPPFGDTSDRVAGMLDKAVPIAKKNTYIASIAIGENRLLSRGMLGAITDGSFVHQTRYEEFREFLLDAGARKLSCMTANGWGVLDSYVETASFVLNSSPDTAALFTDLRDFGDDRPEKLLTAIKDVAKGSVTTESVFLLTAAFRRIPKSVLTFWLPTPILEAYRLLPSLAPTLVDARCGISSNDNPRFYKLRWEVPPAEISRNKKWVFLANGGSPAPLFRQQFYVVNYERDGAEIKTLVKELFGSDSRKVINQQYYFRAGLTYGKRTESFTVQFLPGGHVFSNEGQAIFPIESIATWHILAYLNTSLVAFLLNSVAGQHKESGYVGSLPSPPNEFLEAEWVGKAMQENYRDLAGFAQAIPEAQSFSSLVNWQGLSSPATFKLAAQRVSGAAAEFSKRFERADDLLERSLGFSRDSAVPWEHRSWDVSTILYDVSGDELVNIIVHDCIGYAIGIIFGRWDIRYATGEQASPELPDPFSPLPVCPPGQLLNAEGLPARSEDVPAAYPVCILWDGILVDDLNHHQDIERHVREVIGIIWHGNEHGPTAEAIEHEACEILGVKSLREYIRKPSGFFAEHLKRYSKSRRQAPIYWRLSAGNSSYSAWLYYHSFTADTLYQVLDKFVQPRIQQAEREQFELISQGALSGDSATRLQEAQTLLQDLRLLKSELDLVAPLWNPNLNDGVIINHAILWRITPFTPWQKKCKECWDKLVKGEYDWAHLALHLWPERVIPKCTTDRSLAIAHGLEERLWRETNNGNWLPRQLSEADLHAVIAEHSNPAVKSALERFLAAPPPFAPTRTRASGSSAPRRTRGTAAVVDAEASSQVLLALTAAPSDGLAKAAIADLIGVEANTLTAVIKQLKESGKIDQLGERRGARYVLSEQGRAAVEQEEAT